MSWRLFRYFEDMSLSNKSGPEFYYFMSNIKDRFDNSEFGILSDLMTRLMVRFCISIKNIFTC